MPIQHFYGLNLAIEFIYSIVKLFLSTIILQSGRQSEYLVSCTITILCFLNLLLCFRKKIVKTDVTGNVTTIWPFTFNNELRSIVKFKCREAVLSLAQVCLLLQTMHHNCTAEVRILVNLVSEKADLAGYASVAPTPGGGGGTRVQVLYTWVTRGFQNIP